MKKKLLFVIDSLGVGGAEKSLVTLLSLLDYSRFEVDLQLFAYGGLLSRFLPSEVNVLPPLNYARFIEQPIWKQLLRPALFWARIGHSLRIRKHGLLHSEKACIYWKSIGRHIDHADKDYDAAIAYAQGVATFYVTEKVSASKRLAWVNTDYRLKGEVRDFQRQFYRQCDVIVPVSDHVFNVFAEVYPEFKHKMTVMWDIVDSNIVSNMSLLPSEKHIDNSLPVIMTVGRLTKQKGYDLALKTAEILRDRGVEFRWYVVGEGDYRNKMEQYIADRGLQEHFILLGATANPYSYMSRCDVYVQTSRHEGFGLTIMEARMLNKPVVCTDFDGCAMQMIDGKNGLVTSFEPEDIACAIERLLKDKNLYREIQEYLRQEKKGNTEILEAFYKLTE